MSCVNNEPTTTFEYLKPLSIDSLFEVDDCTKYADTLEKAKRVRNAFFAAKTSVYNFINDCDIIADSLQSDLSDNTVEMLNIQEQYFAVLNNLTSSLYTSLKQTYNNRALINVDLAKVSGHTDSAHDSLTGDATHDVSDAHASHGAARPQKSNDLIFTHPYGKGPTTLCYIPGVTIQLNKANKLLKVKFSQPLYHSGYNRHGQYKKEVDQITTLVVAPSIYCTTSFANWNETTGEKNTFGHCNAGHNTIFDASSVETVFDNVDIAMDFFEEFQNYQDNYILQNDSSYGNEVLEVMNYFDRVIGTMEGAHKFVVQLSKINGTVNTPATECCNKDTQGDCL